MAPALVAAVLAGCSASALPAVDDEQLTVLAASSLQSVFTGIGQEFEAAHPGTRVRFDFAGSADLVARLREGAPGDVLATADEASMDRATQAGLTGRAEVFATNSMIVAVPPDNPARIRSLADVAAPGVALVICAPQVPCGAAAQQVAVNAGLQLRAVSEENAATSVVAKVATGQADAGIVYKTDVAGSDGTLKGVPIPDGVNVVNRYPVAEVVGSEHLGLARSFSAWLLGAQGRAALAAAGFGTPGRAGP